MSPASIQAPQRDRVAAATPLLFAVVLAAGAATRFGSTKQLARLHGDTLAARAIRSAEKLCGARSVLVTGHDAAAVLAACAPLAGFFVLNDSYADGLATSVAGGVSAVRHVADGVLLMLADQPLVTPEHLQQLAACWAEEPVCAVASRYAGVIGVPAILPRSDFAALCALEGDAGAKGILAAHRDKLRLIDCAEAALDIDRPSDLEALL
ncbi:MAG: nucleotidyltransferase family protein [Woeseia sp.]